MVLEAIKYDSETKSLEIVDQLQLPYKLIYQRITSINDAWQAIRNMQVRGAPAIAMVGLLGVVVDLLKTKAFDAGSGRTSHSKEQAQENIQKCLDYVVTSRPTAVNLQNGTARIGHLCRSIVKRPNKSAVDVYVETIGAIEAMLDEDRQCNQAMGSWGAQYILEKVPSGGSVSVITHCNTGSLATAGYGTALGVIRSLHRQGRLQRAFYTETRPYNQGSRLTAFELGHDNIPATLITDSMAAALMQLRKEANRIGAVVVGADRIAANGDTANKVGTYALAILAKHHEIDFLVAAPFSTIDLSTASGANIKIEERPGVEMTSISGPVMTNTGEVDLQSSAKRVKVAAEGIEVWNPAFDVTPANLITGIVTEKGVIAQDHRGFIDIDTFYGSHIASHK